MIKIIATLSVLLIISLIFNYNQYNSSQVNKLLLSLAENNVKELNKSLLLKDEKVEVTEKVYETVSKNTEKSNKSFDDLKQKLSDIDCKKPEKQNEKVKPSDTADIVKYYNVLHSAYKIQDKD